RTTRTVCFAAASTLLACGLCLGAGLGPEASTYVDGNIAALRPNTGGTLVFTDNSTMTFKTGLAEVSVPYSGIHKAELGATRVHSGSDPAYKVWLLPKRLHRSVMQLLTVDFRNRQGQDRTMTLELAKSSASAVLSAIQERTQPITQPQSSGWWGDSIWKTQSNAANWK
ncbi:MAG TPA: hypothetical protein VFW83_06925, partial [Bryobacteraceae bacterium]|nr:hypothetical protein [Bryobacteraceae bacterium]